MQYMLLIYEDESIFGDGKDNQLLQDLVGKHRALAQSLGPTLKIGAGLKGTATATTIRSDGHSHTIHDGPFAETKEQLGGFYLVDVDSLDEAMEIARRIPFAAGGSVEIRPLIGGDGAGA